MTELSEIHKNAVFDDVNIEDKKQEVASGHSEAPSYKYEEGYESDLEINIWQKSKERGSKRRSSYKLWEWYKRYRILKGTGTMPGFQRWVKVRVSYHKCDHKIS